MTRSTEEAMQVLATTRAFLINKGREVAEELIQRNGSTHSRAVRAALVNRGILTPDIEATMKEFWLGAVFNSKRFTWTGEWFNYSDSARNVHERTVKVWRLAAA